MSYRFQPPLPTPGQIDDQRLTPTLLWRSCHELSQNCRASMWLSVLTLLGGIGIVAQGRYDIKMPYGAIKPTSINTLRVAGSDDGNSLIYDKVLNVIHEAQRKERREWRKRMNAYHGELDQWHTEKKVLTQAIYREQAKGGTAERERHALRELHQRRPEPPREFRLLYRDTTPEALFACLETAIPSAALAIEEAEDFFQGPMYQARGQLNTLWSGGSTVITLASKDNIVLDDARLTQLLMVQPGTLQRYMETQGQQARNSDMFASFIVCAPPSIRGHCFYSPTTTPKWGTWEQAEARLARLTQENLILAHAPDMPREVLEFTEQGAACWRQIDNEIERQKAPGGYYTGCPDHASKLKENIARVAALIHLFEGYEGEIEPMTVLMAMDLCLYYSGHFQQVFMPPSQEEQDAYRLSEWFNEPRQFNCRILLYKDVVLRGPQALRNKQRRDAAIVLLISRNQIKVFTHHRNWYIDLMPWMGPPHMGSF